MKPPISLDCSLTPELLFVDWLKILANAKQEVQFQSPTVLVCEQKQCSHMLDAVLYARFSSEHTLSPAIFAFFTTPLVIMDYVRSNKGGMKLLFQDNLYEKQKVLSSGAVC